MICTEPACAKLNLALDILGKRPDGYHEMRMVMQSIDLADHVTVSTCPGKEIVVTTDLPYLPKGDGNIAAKAALWFFSSVGMEPEGLAIDIQKNVPVCAGMAGGSSDGAAVLRVLRRLYMPDMTEEQLEEIGALVGSDVPYCVRGGTVLAEGRGERLTDLPPLPPCWLVVCKPSCSVSTPELFAQVRLKKLRCHPDTAGMMNALERQDLEGIARRLYNVFEDVLPRRYAEVFVIKNELLELGAMAASMTGSGPTVFGIFQDQETAAQAAGALSKQYAAYLCRPCGAAGI
ncbi:MAG: 4-(cytidine 5'-diphospho)-2-C-methyl-D-erythritol kinase [Oscillospiraceae bacterium]|jgi:4-diphosphocytidyl-2-C-methyl-D-erythritol kinase|nr:4-(cytidine 5'-diphospho)-2-C-methyl-D-erythritol kinase [Oscillospiraceae bacterium]